MSIRIRVALEATLVACVLLAPTGAGAQEAPDFEGIRSAESTPAKPAADRRPFYLAERIRLEAEIRAVAGPDYPLEALVSGPTKGASAEKLRQDALSLRVAEFRLGIAMPVRSPVEQPDFGRPSTDDSPYQPLGGRPDAAVRHQRWCRKRLAEVHERLAGSWDAKLAADELTLEASLQLWDAQVREASGSRGLPSADVRDQYREAP